MILTFSYSQFLFTDYNSNFEMKYSVSKFLLGVFSFLIAVNLAYIFESAVVLRKQNRII